MSNFNFHWTKTLYLLHFSRATVVCSAGVFFGRANVFARKSAMLKLPKRGENRESQRERGGGGALPLPLPPVVYYVEI